MEHKLELCLDSFRAITSSNIKNDDYTYRPSKEALKYAFLQFGSKYFSRTLSVDVDNTTDLNVIKERILAVNIPFPTFTVKTNKGFHLHWVLELPIKANTKASYLRNLINDSLITALDGDVRAKGLRRVWRNPLKHSTIFVDEFHSLKFFKHLIPEKKTVKRDYSTRKSRSVFVDWSKVTVGERHDTLFKVISKHAYSLHKLEPQELLSRVHNFGNYCNSLLPEPQSQSEIDSLCSSITTWVVTKYTGASERTTKFNKKLGLHRTDVTKMKILTMFYTLLAQIKSLRDISSMSVRQGGKVCGVSKNTYHKYRNEIYNLLLDNLKLIELHFTAEEQDIIFNERTFKDVITSMNKEYRDSVP